MPVRLVPSDPPHGRIQPPRPCIPGTARVASRIESVAGCETPLNENPGTS